MSTFTLFKLLPAELRIKIWHNSLPTIIKPAMCRYDKDKKLWRPRTLTPLDSDFDPINEANIRFEFRVDLLEDIQFELPLPFVNHEARAITLAWVRKHGLKPIKDRPHIFFRPFDIKSDAIYVASKDWHDFIVEPVDRMFEPDLIGRTLSSGRSVRTIAIPGALFRAESDIWDDLFLNHYGVSRLLIVTGATRDVLSGMKWCGFDECESASLVWNCQSRELDLCGDGKGMRDEDSGLLEELVSNPAAVARLAQDLESDQASNFEIRLVKVR